MNPNRYNDYRNDDTFDTKLFLDTLFNRTAEKDPVGGGIKLTMEKLHYFFKFGNVKGSTLIDISHSSMLPHLFSATEKFKDIYLLRFDDKSIKEIKKSLQQQPGAFDWQYLLTFVAKKEGNQGKSQQKMRTLSTAVKDVLKYSTDINNVTDPIQLPPADCLFMNLALDAISEDQADYIKKFKQFDQMLKPGGLLLLYGLLKATFFIVGGVKYNLLEYNEDFVRNVLEGEGYTIKHCDVHFGKAASDLSDCTGMIFVVAEKKK